MLLLYVNNSVGIFTGHQEGLWKRKKGNILAQRAKNSFGLPLWFVNHIPVLTVRKLVLCYDIWKSKPCGDMKDIFPEE